MEDGSAVLITNRFGVFVGSKENGVAVGLGEATAKDVGVWRKGMEMGSPLQLDKRETNRIKNKDLFIIPLA